MNTPKLKTYDVYLASPLFCQEDNQVLDIVEAELDRMGLSYFSPRHDSTADFSKAKTKEERDAVAQQIFELNETAIANSRIVLANTIGTRYNNAIYSDAGTMIEIGMAVTANIPVVTFNFKGYGLNIMISQKAVFHCDKLSLTNYEQLSVLKPIIDSYDQGLTADELRQKFWESLDSELV